MHEEPAREVSDEGAGAGAEPAEALQVRRQLPDLDAVPRNTRINCDIRDRERRRHAEEAHERGGGGEVPGERDSGGGDGADDTGDDEVGSAAVSSDGEGVGEDSPKRFENPGDEVNTYEELNGGGLKLLHVFPVVVCHYLEEWAREPLPYTVDEEDADHEGRV